MSSETPVPLRELCAKATSGPWKIEGAHLLDNTGRNTIAVFAQGWSDDEPTLELIARCSPEVMLKVYEALTTAKESKYFDRYTLSQNDRDKLIEALALLDDKTP